MTDAAEVGASIAWRLLATLEGGSLLLVTSALLAYTASSTVRKRRRRPCHTVLLTNATSDLGADLKRRLESHGCAVSTATSGATSSAGSGNVDALVVVGAKLKTIGLNGISDLVMEDVHGNLKLLESLSSRVSRGGSIAWACAETGAEAGTGAFTDTTAAFDVVLQASLQHIAKIHNCEAIWVGRCDSAAERLVAALMAPHTPPYTYGVTIRNAASKVGKYLYRCLKIIT